jgi:hypothetical protein
MRLCFSTHEGRILLLFTRTDEMRIQWGLLIRLVSLHERLNFPSEIRGG